MPIDERVRDLAIALTRRPSVTATPDEAAYAPWLASLLAGDGIEVRTVPVPGDRLGRANVLALARGPGPGVVVLTGHFDTVPIDDYGDLIGDAVDPDRLTAALLARLDVSNAHPGARAELADGSFIPGRGLLDMKAGVAAGIAAVRAHAQQPDRRGSLLLIASPDEEDRSVGLRAAAAVLPALLAEWGLTPRLAINLDAVIDGGDGSAGRLVAFGCVGKHLLSALVIGREAHACYPWRGINASHLAAELVCAIECAPDLSEGSGVECAAPPTVLGSRDTKAIYNVTTPGRVWTTWNVLVQRRTAAEIMAVARDLAEQAIATARDRMAARAAALPDAPAISPGWERIAVLDYAGLFARAAAADPAFAARFAARAQALADDGTLDLPTRARALTELAWDASGLEGPAIVLGYASMPYPATAFGDAALQARLTRAAHATAARHGTTVTAIDHLPVIVDMSFIGHIDADDLRHAAAQSPLWGSSIAWSLDRPTPDIPTINVGPWGRDYHHWLERVHAGYAFGVLPELVADLAAEALR